MVKALSLAAIVLVGAPCLRAGPLLAPADRDRDAEQDPVVIRLYNVQDLVLSQDVPYWGPVFPPTSLEAAHPWITRTAGDLFGTVAEEEGQPALGPGLSPGVLVELIRRTIDPLSWYGDPHIRIDHVGTLLVVVQTEANQERIAAFIDQFRVAFPILAIEARWMVIPEHRLKTLIADSHRRQPKVPRLLTEEALARAEAMTMCRAQLTCFDRQTVHVASGTGHSVFSNVEPVVAEAVVGWTPTVTTLLSGALLEVTPALSGDRSAVTMKVHSVITQMLESPTRVTESGGPGGAIPPTKTVIDLPHFLLHTFRTTVRMPLGRPVLVGGITGPNAPDGHVVYLVVEVDASDNLAPAEVVPAEAQTP
jgi:hypothetical protein